MTNLNFSQPAWLTTSEGAQLAIINVSKLFGNRLHQLPFVLRILLENIIRTQQDRERDESVAAIFAWLESRSSQAEISFQPNRVLMHDTTSTPALVDIAAMRDTLAEAGLDPCKLNPTLPVDISVDHSLAVEAFARDDAADFNLNLEIDRNQERYQFLRWASTALTNVTIHPPGTGIMHTINLEQLATVVTTQRINGVLWAIPDTLIGTDSHTPMINGLGVLGWGVGGLEAQTVMFGLPTMLKIPDVIGVKLIGSLRSSITSTDLALTVTQQLRALDVTGQFVEFFGSGVSSLTAGDRAVVANMAPEYGATTGFFPVDEKTLDYLRTTGRTEKAIQLVEDYCRQVGFWFDPNIIPNYTKTLEIDLSSITSSVAGPKRPQDRMAYSQIANNLKAIPIDSSMTQTNLPRYPVAIAAITSCTNTSDPRLLVQAGLLARKARQLGLKPSAWVKTSLAPGSPAAASYLDRAGLLEDLAALGFDIVGYGCTTCIGNSGGLTEIVRQYQVSKSCQPVAILSGNRNFPGRVHPQIDFSFIMSPALVIAFAIIGDAQVDLSQEPLGIDPSGTPIFLQDLMPTNTEINQILMDCIHPEDFKNQFQLAAQNPKWYAIAAQSTPLFPWESQSNYLRRPPFAALSAGSLLGKYTALPLLVLGDDITTDHISPASAIPFNSYIADYLVTQGDQRDDLNVFASRRGNWEVMLRATFFNQSLINLLGENLPTGYTLHIPSGQRMPIWEVAKLYQSEGRSSVIVAGERYGMGSSRDWAAKGQRLLGVKAVIAVSYERIHRSNLIGMGILPLILLNGATPHSLKILAGDFFTIDIPPNQIKIRGPLNIQIHRVNNSIENIEVMMAIETQMEMRLLRDGGVIPMILKRNLSSPITST